MTCFWKRSESPSGSCFSNSFGSTSQYAKRPGFKGARLEPCHFGAPFFREKKGHLGLAPVPWT